MSNRSLHAISRFNGKLTGKSIGECRVPLPTSRKLPRKMQTKQRFPVNRKREFESCETGNFPTET